LQVALIISVTNKGAEFQSIYGAVNPIVTLLFTAALSSTNGARTVSAYNYGAGN
jgi:Na+-driven multidrug efflux pump